MNTDNVFMGPYGAKFLIYRHTDKCQSSHYLPVGLTHILFGWDHLLFLTGLLLLATRARTLLVLVTCFTISHCLALALSVLNIVNLSSAIIEPLIALSIVYVAIENIIKLHKLKTSNSPPNQLNHNKYQWLMITAFGFIHGFGFSFLLKAMGQTDNLLPSLLFFNLGVEAGQLLFVVPLFLLLNKVPQLWQQRYTAAIEGGSLGTQYAAMPNLMVFKQTIAFMTCLMGVYWLIARTVMT